MRDYKSNAWNESYRRHENHIFFPKEEALKFLSRYVVKKIGVDEFKPLITTDKLKGLDLGCGIGRNTLLMEELGIEAYGLDLSSDALAVARDLARKSGRAMDNRFVQAEGNTIPFPDNYFDIAISDAVLDSLEFNFAKEYLVELDRTVTRFVYLNLISVEAPGFDVGGRKKEIVVDSKHENGTIQSFFDASKIHELISGTKFSIKQLYLSKQDDLLSGKTVGARLHVVLSK